LRDRASDQERFFIAATYDRQVTGNLQKERETLESWARTYPRERDAHGLLSGFASAGTGKYQESIEEAQKTIMLDPNIAFAYASLVSSYFYLDRLREAENALEQASERNLEIPDFPLFRYFIAFLRGDDPGMERAVAQAKGKSGAEDWMAHSEALVLARSGRLLLARRMSDRAMDAAQQAGQRERAAMYEAARAVWEGFYGNSPEARRDAMAVLAYSRGRDVEYAAAFALARSGELSRSQTLTDDLEKRFPEDTSVRFTYVPVLRALFALNRGQPVKAIEQLQTAAPYELAMSGISFNGFYGGLYAAYVRGEAYLAARQSAAAAAEFQKVLDHPGIVQADPIGALAHLQLGRAFALAGDRTRAKAAYQDFLALWKDADPGVPILKQARAEYSRLQ
jgi:hypothetical protein